MHKLKLKSLQFAVQIVNIDKLLYMFQANAVAIEFPPPHHFSEPALHDLFSIPDTDRKWFHIGLQLGLDESTLQNIVKGANNNDLKRKREMFRKVLEAKPNLTWRDMLLALKSVGEFWLFLYGILSWQNTYMYM